MDKKVIGPLEIEKRFSGSFPQPITSYPAADKWLKEFVVPEGGTMRA